MHTLEVEVAHAELALREIGEERLEQGLVVGPAAGGDFLDEAPEGEIPVFVGVDQVAPDLAYEFLESGTAGEVGAEHEGVEEVADEVLGVGVVPAVHGQTDADVVLTAPAGQQCLVGRQQHHESGRVVAVAEGGEGLDEGCGQAEAHHVAPESRGRGTRAVEGHVQSGGGTFETAGPVVEEFTQPLTAQRLALPEGVVGVLGQGLGQR
ncbi:hypothetical protein EES45_01645 [Streptomyces sp. ADI97-07]|nr:hypothetical protein EES45_01645 [Streptomyces sp. ADI97-07]